MNTGIYGKRMVTKGVVLPEVLVEQVQELIDDYAANGIYLNFASAIRFILEQYFTSEQKENKENV